ncbi:hypothetical protein HDU67_004977 [Dinochytrium kinnereticum]|nr:hypothetical protein HDU67_004977 [Dinochytrium kinnereticum]
MEARPTDQDQQTSSPAPIPLNQNHRRISSQVLDPIDKQSKAVPLSNGVETNSHHGSSATMPTWTRPSLSDIQRTTAEIDETISIQSRMTLTKAGGATSHGMADIESDDGGMDTVHSTQSKRRRSSVGKRSKLGHKDNSLDVNKSHGHVPKGRNSKARSKSRDHSPNGSIHQVKTSHPPNVTTSHSRQGSEKGKDHQEEKENKALRDFLDGIGESDVPASSSSPNMPTDEDSIPGAIPEEFRNYLGKGTSPTSPTQPKSAMTPKLPDPTPDASDNSIDREIGAMKSKMEVERENDIQIRSAPSLDPTQLKQSPLTTAQRSHSGNVNSVQKPQPAATGTSARRSSMTKAEQTSGKYGNRPSHPRRVSQANDDDAYTDGRSTPSDIYTDSDLSQSGPFRHNLTAPSVMGNGMQGSGHGAQAFSGNMGSGAILNGSGFQKHRKKESAGTSAFRFLQCTAPGAIGLMCMGIPVCYLMSLFSSMAVRSNSIVLLFTGIDVTRDSDWTPVPVTVISAIIAMVAADFWTLATLCGCNVLRKFIRDRWTGVLILSKKPATTVPKALLKPSSYTAAILSQTTIQTVANPSETSHQNSTNYGNRRNTVFTGSSPSSIQLKRSDSADSESKRSAGYWFEVRVATAKSGPDAIDGNWWKAVWTYIITPPQGSALPIWSRIFLFVILSACLEWSLAILCLPSAFYNQTGVKGESVFFGISPLCQILFQFPVLYGVVGIGHVDGEKGKESLVAAMLNTAFFQALRYFLGIFIYFFLQITEPTMQILLASLIIPCLADAALFLIMGIPFFRLHILRTKNSALMILRTMFRPSVLEATSVQYANFRSNIEGGFNQVPTTASSAPPAQFDTGPDYALNIVTALSLNGGLLFSIPAKLLILAAPTPVSFFVPAVFSTVMRNLVMFLRVRIFTRLPSAARVGVNDALEEEEVGGDENYKARRPSSYGWNRTSPPVPSLSSQPGSFNDIIFRTPIPRKAALPILAADHMASSLASQASVGIALVALLLLPDVTFPPVLFGSPSNHPLSANTYNSTHTAFISSSPARWATPAPLPSVFPIPVPTVTTLIWRAVVLLVFEWIFGCLFAAFVASPLGVVYGPSQQTMNTHTALLMAYGGPKEPPGGNGGATPTLLGAIGSSSVGNNGAPNAIDQRALRRSFSRRQSAVRVQNLSLVMVDPRLAVISGLEFVRAMGIIGLAISCFWAAVWGIA